VETKVCSNPDCSFNGQPQPLSAFYRHRGHKDGHASRCKTCCKAARKPEVWQRYYHSEKGQAARRQYDRCERRKAYKQQYYQENRERILAKTRQANKTEHRKAIVRKYQHSPKGRRMSRLRMRRYRAKATEQWLAQTAARKAVNHAVEYGRIPPVQAQQCVDCEKQAEHYHHRLGYEREHWLDVVPLCAECHKRHHLTLDSA
jgi:hypothetical protein